MNVLIIDKHPIIRKGLTLIIEENYPNADITVSGINKLVTPLKSPPDLAILGVTESNEPQCILLIRALRAQYPGVRVIAYDEAAVSPVSLRFLQIGVDGYISKQIGVQELLKCIQDVSSGKKYVSTTTLMELLKTATPLASQIEHKRKTRLTQLEEEIAVYLSKGIKTSVIAEKLGRKVSTISSTKAKIFRKLNVDNIISLGSVLRHELAY